METQQVPRIILITGNMAAGKSSVAQFLAERLPRSVHLRGDIFRRMIINGQAEMTANLSDEAYQQLRLRYRIANLAAKEYFHAGFTVIYQDIILGPELEDVINSFAGFPLSVFVLCPRPKVVAARDQARSKTGYPNQDVVMAFDNALRQHTPRLGFWLDSSDMTVPETVDAIFENLHHPN